MLFLNKCDLLEKKLLSAVMVRHFVPSFGDRSNTLPTVANCAFSYLFYFFSFSRNLTNWLTVCAPFHFVDLRSKFRDMSKQHSVEPRPIYTHLTSVIVRYVFLFPLPFFAFAFVFTLLELPPLSPPSISSCFTLNRLTD